MQIFPTRSQNKEAVCVCVCVCVSELLLPVVSSPTPLQRSNPRVLIPSSTPGDCPEQSGQMAPGLLFSLRTEPGGEQGWILGESWIPRIKVFGILFLCPCRAWSSGPNSRAQTPGSAPPKPITGPLPPPPPKAGGQDTGKSWGRRDGGGKRLISVKPRPSCSLCGTPLGVCDLGTGAFLESKRRAK